MGWVDKKASKRIKNEPVDKSWGIRPTHHTPYAQYYRRVENDMW
jgi:hypothetical protein